MKIVLYIVILLLKILEVSIGTTRIVLITRGERVLGALLGFVEVIIWIILISTVLNDVTSDPIKIIVYASGFAMGNYVGSLLEQKLAIGNIRVETIVTDEDGDSLVEMLRDRDFAVTVLVGKGMNHNRQVLLMNIKRKDYQEVVDIIKNHQENVVITINDIKPVYGGYGLLKR